MEPKIPVVARIELVMTKDGRVLILGCEVPNRAVALGMLEAAKFDVNDRIRQMERERAEKVLEVAPAGFDKKIPVPNFGGG